MITNTTQRTRHHQLDSTYIAFVVAVTAVCVTLFGVPAVNDAIDPAPALPAIDYAALD
jgi:hypothetical protein